MSDDSARYANQILLTSDEYRLIKSPRHSCIEHILHPLEDTVKRDVQMIHKLSDHPVCIHSPMIIGGLAMLRLLNLMRVQFGPALSNI